MPQVFVKYYQSVTCDEIPLVINIFINIYSLFLCDHPHDQGLCIKIPDQQPDHIWSP